MMSDADSESLSCSVCRQRLKDPQLLPCLHVLCLSCLRDECSEKSRDRFFCPLCVADPENRRSHHARPWHSFDRIIEKEAEGEALQRRRAELPASQNQRNNSDDSPDDDDEDDDDDNNNNNDKSRQPPLDAPTVFPCSIHMDKLADTFCAKCDQLACHKCVSSFHRRCQNFSDVQDAVEAKRHVFDALHNKMADSLVRCEHTQDVQTRRVREFEDMRSTLLQDIQAFRTEMVNMIQAKEQALIEQTNKMVDEMKKNASDSEAEARKLAHALHKQLDVLSYSFSVGGEGELLAFLPSLMCRVEADAKRVMDKQKTDAIRRVIFTRDQNCQETVSSSPLGTLTFENGDQISTQAKETKSETSNEGKVDLSLTLLTSFHGGSRDDVAEPLLTDLVVLVNGDVILTDRDNKCVKKFNQSGKLLTRVLIEATPSRIAVVSHSRAAVSVMNKKALYYLSLFGTIRVLNTVKVKKIYSFLTSLGDGVLVAGTNLCDSIDVLTEKGELIRNIYTQKADKVSISRPLYLTPIRPVLTFSVNGNHVSHHHHSNHHHQQPHTTETSDSVATKNSSHQADHADIDLLVSDSGKRVLFRLQQNGTVAFTLRSRDDLTLECPLGVTVHESGLTLLADRDSDSVLLLDKGGKYLKRVLTSQEGVTKPCGLYAGHRGRVALSQVDGMVKIYEANVEYFMN